MRLKGVCFMKQHDIKRTRIIDGNTFYVRPFGAFTSANLSGEVTSLVVPIIGSVAPAFLGASTGEDFSLGDVDLETIAPALVKGLESFSGDKVEALLKKLLVKHNNVSVQLEGERDAQILTEDLADEVFCGETQGLFVLAVDVIMANYSGFFKKAAGVFGGQLKGLLQTVKPTSENTES